MGNETNYYVKARISDEDLLRLSEDRYDRCESHHGHLEYHKEPVKCHVIEEV